MTDSHQKTELSLDSDSMATLEPVDRVSDPGLLDELAKKLNAAPIRSETVDFGRLQQLEARLTDREQLVSILTDRLEQTNSIESNVPVAYMPVRLRTVPMQQPCLPGIARSQRNWTDSSMPGKNVTKAQPFGAWKPTSKICVNGSNRRSCKATSLPVNHQSRVFPAWARVHRKSLTTTQKFLSQL